MRSSCSQNPPVNSEGFQRPSGPASLPVLRALLVFWVLAGSTSLSLRAATPILSPEPGGVETAGLSAPTAAMSVVADGLTVTEEWYRTVFGRSIGATGLNAVDLDDDGKAEIVAAALSGGYGYNSYWYVLKKGAGRYYQAFVSTPYAQYIASITTADVDGDKRPEIIVGTGRDILVYSGTSYALLRTITTAVREDSGIYCINVADVDSDDEMEYVFTSPKTFSDDDALFIYGATSGAQKYRGGYGGDYTLAVGNVDSDADIEIVVNGASGGYVLNGKTRAVEWNYPPGFGYHICTGDLDGDGMQEIVADGITVLDADLHSPKYEIPTDHDTAAVKLADVDKDGKLDLVYGEGQWGSVYVHDGAAGTLKWSVVNPEGGVTEMAIADTDGDGVNELLWGTFDYLYVVDTVTRVCEWRNDSISGPFYAMDHGDVDNDGQPEFLYGCDESDKGYGDGLFFIHDAVSKALEYESPAPTGLNWTGLWRIRTANIDSDPQAEVFITTSTTYDGIIICYDGINHQEQWRFNAPSSLTFNSMAIGDVDSDGQLEVVAGTYSNGGAPGLYFYILNATTGAEKWHSADLGPSRTSLKLLRLADVDADDRPEIVIGGGSVFVYDGLTHIEQFHTEDLGATALETADVNGDGKPEILVGRTNGTIEVRKGNDGSLASALGPFGGQVDGLAVLNVVGDSTPDYIFAVANSLRIYDGAALTGDPVWQSGVIGYNVAYNDSLLAADIDGDGKVEVAINVGPVGFRIYELSSDYGACCIPTAPGEGTCQVISAAACSTVGGTYLGKDSVCGSGSGGCDFCPGDPNKTSGGLCGCGVADTDSDGDGTPDCHDACPVDPAKVAAGACGCGAAETDGDGDGTPDCVDGCPGDPSKIAPGVCGCATPDTDTDHDGTPDCTDACPADANKIVAGLCGCGVADTDTDGDGTPDCHDLCPSDAAKTTPGVCGCGTADTDSDGDGVADCIDKCPAAPDVDGDGDGVLDCQDGCPADSAKTAAGTCGCGIAETDTDADHVPDCTDGCPADPAKIAPGVCGCGAVDTDSDNDGTSNCNDACPQDRTKITAGACGCGNAETDSDGDGVANCIDGCPHDAGKSNSGTCGCGTPDTDSDHDGTPDCRDACPQDAGKTSAGACGCGTADTDTDHDGTPNCKDACPQDAAKTVAGICGCGKADTDSDHDGAFDCQDACPLDAAKITSDACGCGRPETDSDRDGVPDCVDGCKDDLLKIAPGACGCGSLDLDSDGDGAPDCVDLCPNNPAKADPGRCGCGRAETDSDGDGVPDCVDNCAGIVNSDQADTDGNGVGDACTPVSPDQTKPTPEPQEPSAQPAPVVGVCGAGLAQTAALCLCGLMLVRLTSGRRRR